MNSQRSNQKGFTLVEILIVVIILAILAGVVIPQFSSSSDEAKLSVLQSDLATMRGAAELYYHQHNSTYPGDVTSNYSQAMLPMLNGWWISSHSTPTWTARQ